jgi:hypothetical protein
VMEEELIPRFAVLHWNKMFVAYRKEAEPHMPEHELTDL